MIAEVIKYSRRKQVSPVCKRNALLVFLLAIMLVTGCTGVQTFSQTAYPGDTVAMAIGRQDVKFKNATIIITDSSGFSQSFPANDPLVRSWINVYPDPVSKFIVGRETGNNLGSGAWVWGVATGLQVGERDLYDTMVFLDLPANLAPGVAVIDIQVAGTSILAGPVSVNVLSGTGASNPFDIREGGLQPQILDSMRRAKHYTISFTGTEVPAAIQVQLSHNPDRENGGVGQAYVASPRGDIMNPTWTDDGVALRVILANAWQKSAEDLAVAPSWQNDPDFTWFKFYVAGGITGLQIDNISAFDVNGNPVTGVMAVLQ